MEGGIGLSECEEGCPWLSASAADRLALDPLPPSALPSSSLFDSALFQTLSVSPSLK